MIRNETELADKEAARSQAQSALRQSLAAMSHSKLRLWSSAAFDGLLNIMQQPQPWEKLFLYIQLKLLSSFFKYDIMVWYLHRLQPLEYPICKPPIKKLPPSAFPACFRVLGKLLR